MSRESLLIFGAGSQARLALNTALCMDRFEVRGLIDICDNPSIWGTQVNGTTVMGGLSILDKYPPGTDTLVCVAIGDQETKKRVVEILVARGLSFATLLHPTSCIAETVRIGVGCIVNAGVIIEPDAHIGDHVVIRAGCVISHDVVLKDFVSLSPGVTLAGRSRVENGAMIYTAATLAPDAVVGADAIVGAGSLVLKDIPPKTVAFGVPALPRPGRDM